MPAAGTSDPLAYRADPEYVAMRDAATYNGADPAPLAAWLRARGATPEARYWESGDYRSFEAVLQTGIRVVAADPSSMERLLPSLAMWAFATAVVRGDFEALYHPGPDVRVPI